MWGDDSSDTSTETVTRYVDSDTSSPVRYRSEDERYLQTIEKMRSCARCKNKRLTVKQCIRILVEELERGNDLTRCTSIEEMLELVPHMRLLSDFRGDLLRKYSNCYLYKLNNCCWKAESWYENCSLAARMLMEDNVFVLRYFYETLSCIDLSAHHLKDQNNHYGLLSVAFKRNMHSTILYLLTQSPESVMVDKMPAFRSTPQSYMHHFLYTYLFNYYCGNEDGASHLCNVISIIKQYVSLDKKVSDGKTILRVVLMKNIKFFRSICEIVSVGDLSIPDQNGDTLLHDVASAYCTPGYCRSHVEYVFEYLVRYAKCSLWHKNNDDVDPFTLLVLHLACMDYSEDVIRDIYALVGKYGVPPDKTMELFLRVNAITFRLLNRDSRFWTEAFDISSRCSLPVQFTYVGDMLFPVPSPNANEMTPLQKNLYSAIILRSMSQHPTHIAILIDLMQRTQSAYVIFRKIMGLLIKRNNLKRFMICYRGINQRDPQQQLITSTTVCMYATATFREFLEYVTPLLRCMRNRPIKRKDELANTLAQILVDMFFCAYDLYESHLEEFKSIILSDRKVFRYNRFLNCLIRKETLNTDPEMRERFERLRERIVEDYIDVLYTDVPHFSQDHPLYISYTTNKIGIFEKLNAFYDIDVDRTFKFGPTLRSLLQVFEPDDFITSFLNPRRVPSLQCLASRCIVKNKQSTKSICHLKRLRKYVKTH